MINLLRNDKGAALISTLGVLAVVAILGAGALTLAGGSLNQTMWDKASHQAFNVAEAGFDQAVARAREGTLDEDFVAILPNGEASVTVTALGSFFFSVKSVGAHPNLSEPEALRAVAGKITAIGAYEVLFADGASGIVLGSTKIDGPLYVRDYLGLSGDGAFTGGPLFIKDNPATPARTGDLELGGSSSVGTAADPIFAFIDGTYPASSPNLHTIEIFRDVPDLEIPVITDSLEDMNGQRDLADLIIDDDGLTNGSNPLTFDKNASPVTYGSYPAGPYLKWETPTNKKRILRIKGSIFVDGPVSMGANQIDLIEYYNKGTIIANGLIAINSAFMPSVVSDFPASTAVGLLTGSQVDINPKSGDSVYALVYAYEQINFVSQQDFYGSAMTQVMDVRNNPFLHIVEDLSAWDLPPGMPKVAPGISVTDWKEVVP